MLDQASNAPVQAPMRTSPPVKLWTPGFIAGVSFFLGFPAGIVLASMNWMRMKMSDKAVTHLIAGAVGTFIFMVILMLIPGTMGSLLALATNLGILFYLQRQMKQDLENFATAQNSFENANQLGGCLIGLGVLLLVLILAFVLAFVLVILGVPIPE